MRKLALPSIAAILITLALIACKPILERTIAPELPDGAIQHLVIVWLKDPGNEDHRQAIIDVSLSFRDIPGVLHVSAGRMVPSERSIVDSSFDVGILITLADQAALDAYLPNPLHVTAVQEVIRPLVERYIVYDFVIGN
jgi:hypothetical protein